MWMALALAGSVLALRLAWGWREWRAFWVALACALLVIGAALISDSVGGERGVALVLIAFTVPAYVAVIANATWKPRRERSRRNNATRPTPSERAKESTALKHLSEATSPERANELGSLARASQALPPEGANDHTTPKHLPEATPPERSIEPATLNHLTARWLLAGLGGALAAIALATSLAAWSPGVLAVRTVLAIIAIPLLWALFAGWSLATRRPLIVSLWMAACTLGGAGAIAVSLFT